MYNVLFMLFVFLYYDIITKFLCNKNPTIICRPSKACLVLEKANNAMLLPYIRRVIASAIFVAGL